jgi:hypothetical protein
MCPFPVVAAYLRLGRKYEIEHLRTEALSALSMAFPSTCDGFLALSDNGQGPIAPYPALFFDVIALAREADKLDILPAVYFSYCGSYQIDEVLGGIEREDGTLSILSAEDQKSLLRGWHTLIDELPNQTLYWLLPDAEHECENQGCDLARNFFSCVCSLVNSRGQMFRFQLVSGTLNGGRACASAAELLARGCIKREPI